ncbi:lytic transglycosylase domain-containing protein [Paenibacillus oenotherae]|uniref:Lytic transglycosylase domain-containing protein n=1 Tax=Paenibacillus oenotherae TaxID=1435645 RepID=A0ABS7D1F2_9BACL|nr:lytic transglycosylase domain-containing protein [Paenibacillus oenotherae]MBW7473683.1 lytic transglycosylase domain-containing protein [Paenibacillus oenotherae]
MSIDPRIMKTMLQLQWMQSLDMNGSGTSNVLSPDNQDGSLFGTMLSQLLSGAAEGGGFGNADVLSSTSSTAALMPLLKGSLPLTYNGEYTATAASANPTAYDNYIEAAAAKYNVDPALVKAVIDTESSYNPNAVSSAGAKGLMQLMDGTARGLGVSNSFDPQQNIEGGTRYLSYLLNKYDGNVQAALAGYNAGPGRVDRAGIHNNADVAEKLHLLPQETQKYIAKVMNAHAMYGLS